MVPGKRAAGSFPLPNCACFGLRMNKRNRVCSSAFARRDSQRADGPKDMLVGDLDNAGFPDFAAANKDGTVTVIRGVRIRPRPPTATSTDSTRAWCSRTRSRWLSPRATTAPPIIQYADNLGTHWVSLPPISGLGVEQALTQPLQPRRFFRVRE